MKTRDVVAKDPSAPSPLGLAFGSLELAQRILERWVSDSGCSAGSRLDQFGLSEHIWSPEERLALTTITGEDVAVNPRAKSAQLHGFLVKLRQSLQERMRVDELGLRRPKLDPEVSRALAQSLGVSAEHFQLACETVFLEYVRANEREKATAFIEAFSGPSSSGYHFDLGAIAQKRIDAALTPAKFTADEEDDFDTFFPAVAARVAPFLWVEALGLKTNLREWLNEELDAHLASGTAHKIPNDLRPYLDPEKTRAAASDFLDECVDDAKRGEAGAVEDLLAILTGEDDWAKECFDPQKVVTVLCQIYNLAFKKPRRREGTLSLSDASQRIKQNARITAARQVIAQKVKPFLLGHASFPAEVNALLPYTLWSWLLQDFLWNDQELVGYADLQLEDLRKAGRYSGKEANDAGIIKAAVQPVLSEQREFVLQSLKDEFDASELLALVEVLPKTGALLKACADAEVYFGDVFDRAFLRPSLLQGDFFRRLAWEDETKLEPAREFTRALYPADGYPEWVAFWAEYFDLDHEQLRAALPHEVFVDRYASLLFREEAAMKQLADAQAYAPQLAKVKALAPEWRKQGLNLVAEHLQAATTPKPSTTGGDA